MKKTLLFVTLAVASLFLYAWSAGYSLAYNSSPSVPKGIYLLRPMNGILERGQIVALCIPNETAAKAYADRKYFGDVVGPCPAGLPRLLKPIGALPGDVVEMSQVGTWINGRVVPNSEAQDTDSLGKPIDHLQNGWMKPMESGEYFMLATRIKRSLDSRYYGPVAWSDFYAMATPLITEQE